MTEREQFEAFYGIPIEQRRAPSAGGYALRDYQLMWAAWKASRRAALEEAAKVASVKLNGLTDVANAIRALAQNESGE